MKHLPRVLEWSPRSPLIHILSCVVCVGSAALCHSLQGDALDEWTPRNPHPSGESIRSVTFERGLFVAVGNAGTLLTSSDATNWVNRSGTTIAQLNCVAAANGVFVAVGADGAIIASTNGNTWTRQAAGTIQELRGVTHGPAGFVAVGTGGAISRSADGFNWLPQASPTTNTLESVTFGAGAFVAVGGAPIFSIPPTHVLLTSGDGVTWVNRSTATDQAVYLWGVAYGKGLFLAVGYAGATLTSVDGIDWTLRRAGTDHFYRVEFLNDRFVVIGSRYIPFNDRSELMISPNGLDWTSNNSTSTYGEELYDLAFGNDTFVLASRTEFLTSTDGEAWVRQPKSDTTSLNAVAFGNDMFVAAGNRALTSSAGQDWTPQPTPEPIKNITFGGGIFVATSPESILTSANGGSWIRRWHSDTRPFLNGALAYGNNTFVAAGDNLLTSVDSGETWQSQLNAERVSIRALAFGNGIFVGLDLFSNLIWTSSSDARSWTSKPMNMNEVWRLAYGNGRFVAFGSKDIKYSTYTSSNGVDWLPGAFLNPKLQGLERAPITYGNGIFAALAFYEPVAVCLTSPDGLSWTIHPLNTDVRLAAIGFGNKSFVAVGELGRVFQSGPVNSPYTVTASVESDLAVPGTELGIIRIARSGSAALGIDLTVDFSLSGTARNGVDYRLLPSSVTIPAGQASVALTIAAQGSLDITTSKHIELQLKPGEAYILGTPKAAFVSIDNPGPSPRLRRSGVRRQSDGTVNLVIDSPVNTVLMVEASSDLIAWRTLAQLTNVTGVTTLQDRSAADSGHQFYRVKLPP